MLDDKNPRTFVRLSHKLDQYIPYILLLYLLAAALVILSSIYLATNDDSKIIGQQIISAEINRVAFFDRFIYMILPILLGIIFFCCGVWVYIFRRNDAPGQIFVIYAASTAMFMVGMYDIYAIIRLPYVWIFSLVFSSASLIDLGMHFPHNYLKKTSYRAITWGCYILAITLFLFTISGLNNRIWIYTDNLVLRMDFLFAGFSVVAFMMLMVINRLRTQSPIVREQSRLILWGGSLSFLLLVFWLTISIINPNVAFSPVVLLPVGLFPLIIAYNILRHRLLKIDYVLSRVFLYSLLSLILTVSYSLLVSGLTIAIGNQYLLTNPYIISLIILIIVILINPIRIWLTDALDKLFSRQRVNYREKLQLFSRELTKNFDLSGIVLLLRGYIQNALAPTNLHIFTRDSRTELYVASNTASPSNGHPSSDLRFTTQSALVRTLTTNHSPIFLGDTLDIPSHLQTEYDRLSLLNASLIIPLPGKQHLAGWIALGPRQSGEAYNDRDLEFLESLCDQASLALERLQVVTNLERHMHEMNVLSRVAQGVNITLLFDDILELIYAQTNQIIATDIFTITLLDTNLSTLSYVFYLEDDERLQALEYHPIPQGQGLEWEVIKNRHHIVTDDYERECRSRGVLPAILNLFSWVGVALNAGDEIIGVISLGSKDPSVIYTEEQINLLQAIANQSAGAIVKARLLHESERRTRQLTLLNEVARSLAATLELDPLLEQIVFSAVEIINCEAGILLRVNSDTGEIVVERVVGPIDDTVRGFKFQPGSGFIDKAIKTNQPMMVNQIQQNNYWSDFPINVIELELHHLLLIPMMFKNQVTGAIIVINRIDNMPFTHDDQELLAAFTSQAVIALENARLYTLTDKSLAARVEELSVMQRIDRELNTSLDVSHAMQITLTWAMRLSKADAGLIGIISDGLIRIMAVEGYTSEFSDLKDNALSIDLPAFTNIIGSETPYCQIIGIHNQNQAFLKGASMQMLVPIHRESQVIGVVLLESLIGDPASNEVMSFLSRLSDHAAIAIANAQLYAEVQSANLAKSEFVSFVSHELKTPMTSIKGFSDLLSSGVVGPINEAQSNFLGTIRSNVERMATLVSDLTDVSRIEAGRMRLEFEFINVNEIIDDVIRSIRGQIDSKEQVLILEIPSDLPTMWGDRMRMIQILVNLVSNAHKYTPQKGQIIIRAEQTENIWQPELLNKVIHISVEDTGLGIAQEDQKKIFQKFFRAEDQKIRDVPGTGLGLNITKTLIEMQGGQIWFDSEFRKGTTFHFTIPIVDTI